MEVKKRVLAVALLIILLITLMMVPGVCEEESGKPQTDFTNLYVRTALLNGRANPRKTGFIEARFDEGDILQATGEWSDDHHWIEVAGGETGTVWVYADYVSETKRDFFAQNNDYNRIKIRSRPIDGKITGYLKKGKKITITAVVLGWGKCKKGWIDMSLLEEVQ